MTTVRVPWSAWYADTELDLEFCVPETSHMLCPTARVAWRRPNPEAGVTGLGLQFLKLDRSASRWLEEYVYERAPIQDESAPRPPPQVAVGGPDRLHSGERARD